MSVAFQTFFKLLTDVRVQILERFEIGIGDISYWDFPICLLIAGIVITVLLNVVRASRQSISENTRYFRRRSSSDSVKK